jgi:hypothetical protein
MGADTTQRGYTPRELARVLRISPDRVRALIQSGQLGAIDTARTRSGRPRYVILPCHLDAYVQRHQVSAPPAPVPRWRRRQVRDYYPD